MSERIRTNTDKTSFQSSFRRNPHKTEEIAKTVTKKDLGTTGTNGKNSLDETAKKIQHSKNYRIIRFDVVACGRFKGIDPPVTTPWRFSRSEEADWTPHIASKSGDIRC